MGVCNTCSAAKCAPQIVMMLASWWYSRQNLANSTDINHFSFASYKSTEVHVRGKIPIEMFYKLTAHMLWVLIVACICLRSQWDSAYCWRLETFFLFWWNHLFNRPKPSLRMLVKDKQNQLMTSTAFMYRCSSWLTFEKEFHIMFWFSVGLQSCSTSFSWNHFVAFSGCANSVRWKIPTVVSRTGGNKLTMIYCTQ